MIDSDMILENSKQIIKITERMEAIERICKLLSETSKRYDALVEHLNLIERFDADNKFIGYGKI
ncbi:MAG TPA: hypothetical protein VMW66_06220 [Elusimicrobiales bacterium]|nr:hypothetical protein [Elusimicrobiales bacterium]